MQIFANRHRYSWNRWVLCSVLLIKFQIYERKRISNNVLYFNARTSNMQNNVCTMQPYQTSAGIMDRNYQVKAIYREKQINGTKYLITLSVLKGIKIKFHPEWRRARAYIQFNSHKALTLACLHYTIAYKWVHGIWSAAQKWFRSGMGFFNRFFSFI